MRREGVRREGGWRAVRRTDALAERSRDALVLEVRGDGFAM